MQISPKNRQTKSPLDIEIRKGFTQKGEIMEFAIVFIDSYGSEKSASIKAGSEHKAVELFAHTYGSFDIVEVYEM